MTLIYLITSISQIVTFPVLENHLPAEGNSTPGELRLLFQINCVYLYKVEIVWFGPNYILSSDPRLELRT